MQEIEVLLTQEAFNAIVEANKNYVPFARIMESCRR